MSATSIGRIVFDLVSEGMVFETGQSRSGLGRRATLLDINANSLLAVGVEIDTLGISAGVVNLRGELVVPPVFRPLPDLEVATTLGDTVMAVREVMADLDKSIADKVIAIGATIPGAIGWPNGNVMFSPQFGWENVPFRELLEKEFDTTVFVENNVKASALAELLFGVAQEVPDFAVVTLGSGMGAAVVTEGNLYRGPDNTAGEIGHTTIDPNGPRCDCGRKGCLQMYACISAIERMAGKRFQEVLALAYSGDSKCAQVLDQARSYLAMGLANLASAFNPRFIVVESRFFKVWPNMIQEVEPIFRELLWKPIADQVRILSSGLKEHDAIISGASVVLNEYLTNPVSIRESKFQVRV